MRCCWVALGAVVAVEAKNDDGGRRWEPTTAADRTAGEHPTGGVSTSVPAR